MSQSAFLSSDELARYGRQMLLPQVGLEGQQRLRTARVLVVGAGGLAAPVTLYLAAAGVGHLTLLDGDTVELSNLQRQVIFTHCDLGVSKVEAAAPRLRALNPHLAVEAAAEMLTADNARRWIAGADLVLDCTDNFPTRYLINDVCRHLGKPWLFAAVHRFRGQFALFTPETACFRCLYPTEPVTEGNCSLVGVLGTVPGLLGLWQANEALKYLLGLPESRPGRLWSCDLLDPSLKGISLIPDPDCRCARPGDLPAGHSPGTSSGQEEPLVLTWRDWQALAQQGGLLIDVRSEEEHDAGNAGGEWLAWDRIPARLARLKEGMAVGLYCQRGQRSHALARRLRAEGFVQVYSIRGGLEGRSAEPGGAAERGLAAPTSASDRKDQASR